MSLDTRIPGDNIPESVDPKALETLESQRIQALLEANPEMTYEEAKAHTETNLKNAH
jgi:hypothetical protein